MSASEMESLNNHVIKTSEDQEASGDNKLIIIASKDKPQGIQ